MKKFSILCEYSVGGFVQVEANDIYEARKLAVERIKNEGDACISDRTYTESDWVFISNKNLK